MRNVPQQEPLETRMNELQRALAADSAAAPAAHIVEGLTEASALHRVPGAPHTIYEELWHTAFWQQITLDWIAGRETPVPVHAEHGFPSESQQATESWSNLCHRFLQTLDQAALAAGDVIRLEQAIHCPSPSGKPVRTMTVREQLESLAAHNAYHLGRMVLLRQLLGAWPPPSGGFTW